MSSEFRDLVPRDLANLLRRGFDHDIEIEVGQAPNVKTFKAHMCVLRARSTYFFAALSESWKGDGKAGTVFKKPDISPAVFAVILNYIYTGELSLEQHDTSIIVNLLVAIDELGFTELFDYVETYLLKNRRLWFWQNFATAHNELFVHTVYEKLRAFLTEIMECTPTICFEAMDFTSLSEDTLVRLLESENVQLEEDQIWNYVLQWGLANTPSISGNVADWSESDFTALEKTLRRALPLVRYFQIPPEKFYNDIRPYEAILPDTLVDCLVRFYKKPKKRPAVLALPPRSGSGFGLLPAHYVGLIASWIDRKPEPYARKLVPYYFKLLLRGSRDGFSPAAFHERCDGRGPTVTLIKVAGTEELLGGYAPLSWHSNNSHTATKDAFLFALGEPPIISRVQSDGTSAMYGGDTKGPSFGGGYDLSLAGNEFSADSQNCCQKKHFQQAIRSSSERFNVEEYEVYGLINSRLVGDGII